MKYTLIYSWNDRRCILNLDFKNKLNDKHDHEDEWKSYAILMFISVFKYLFDNFSIVR
jgi:hypothetical protein